MSDQTLNYKTHPVHTNIQVSECGKRIRLADTKIEMVIPTPNAGGYPNFYLGDQNYLMHRLVCETYHENPTNSKIVNHIDGIRRNNHKDNLEWATYSDNLNHAYMTGLRTDNTPVSVKDVRTGEVVVYHSLQECAAKFKVNGEKVYRWLNSKNHAPFEKWYDLSYKDKKFKGITELDFGVVPNGAPRTVITLDADNNLRTYDSMGSAALSLGISRGIVSGQVSGRTPRRRVGDNGYLIWYLTEYPGEVPADVEHILMDTSKKVIPTRVPERVEVTHALTKAVKVYDDIGDFADEVGYKKSAIQKFMNRGYWGNYNLRYIDRKA